MLSLIHRKHYLKRKRYTKLMAGLYENINIHTEVRRALDKNFNLHFQIDRTH